MSHKLRSELIINFSIGAGFIFTNLVILAFLGMAIGVNFKNSFSLETLGTGIGTFNWVLILMTVIYFVVTGLMIYLFAHVRKHLAKPLGLEVKQTPVVQSKKKIAMILTFTVVGIMTSLIFYGFNQFITGISPTQNINSLYSLWTALISGNPWLVLAIFITITTFGFIVGQLAKVIHPLESKIPDIVKG